MDSLKKSNKFLLDRHKSNFSFYSTPFIGRQNDVQNVCAMLADPDCRLVSLVGPGGIGKTRLGIESANQAQHHFNNGAYFVPLQGITSVSQVAPAIASNISCELYGRQDTVRQLKCYLQDKEMLILLDNFEQILDAVKLIVDLLDAASGLKILVTSREVLNLRLEWVWSVTGLRFPEDINAEIDKRDSAVHLFERCAQQLGPDFDLGREKEHVIRICQLVGGIPLAIELASSWLKSLTCEKIADEIQHNLNFLETSMHDIPDRHRSMHAIIEQSWNSLTWQEKDAFKQLSIFRSSFTGDAVDQITATSRAILNSLVDKSLLSYHEGRFHLHELLRQYGQYHLEMNSNESEQLIETHASYYVQFLANRLHSYRSDVSITNEILIELDNIYLMWESIVAGRQYPQLSTAIFCFGAFLHYWFPRHEAIQIIAPAIETYRKQANFPDSLPAYAALLSIQSVYHGRLMQLNEAIALTEECQELVARYNFRPQAIAGSDPLILLGVARLRQGNFEEALALSHLAAENANKYNDIPNSGLANSLLGQTYLAIGQVDNAIQYGLLALSHAKQSKNLTFCAVCTDHLGDASLVARNPAMAEHYYTEGYRYRLEVNERIELPRSMALIGKAKLAQNSYEDAIKWLVRSIDLFSSYEDTASLVVPQSHLALCYTYLNQHDRAYDFFLKAIHAAQLTQVIPLWLVLISNVGDFLIQSGNKEKGLELLTLVINHPMFNRGRDMAIDVEEKLAEIEGAMSEIQFHAAVQAGTNASFEKTILALEHNVVTALTNLYSVEISDVYWTQLHAQGLEQLSEREVEVLELIEAGLTNQEIAERLIISVGTVKRHNHNIYNKLDVKNRTQAIKRARKQNFL